MKSEVHTSFLDTYNFIQGTKNKSLCRGGFSSSDWFQADSKIKTLNSPLSPTAHMLKEVELCAKFITTFTEPYKRKRNAMLIKRHDEAPKAVRNPAPKRARMI